MKLGKKKSIVVSVTNDLVTDQRVHKVCESLDSFGYEVLLVGRRLPDSLELRERNYKCHRMPLLFKRSIFFYAEYNIRLLFFLLRHRPGNVLANDLDTLPANFIYSRMFGKKIFYDSHEYFTEVPELKRRRFSRAFWLFVEKLMLPRLTRTYTVSEEVAKAYNAKYNLKMKVVRNFPRLHRNIRVNDLKKTQNYIVIYQGVLNVDRGLEELIESMKYLEKWVLWVVGGGDIEIQLKGMVNDLGLQEKVIFLGKVPFEHLPNITAKADVGVSIEKSFGLNYQMALPNKLFDYIHAEVPVIVSRLIEIEKIMSECNIGKFIEGHNPKQIAEVIQSMMDDEEKIKGWKAKLKTAKEKYCWENEEGVLREIYLG